MGNQLRLCYLYITCRQSLSFIHSCISNIYSGAYEWMRYANRCCNSTSVKMKEIEVDPERELFNPQKIIWNAQVLQTEKAKILLY